MKFSIILRNIIVLGLCIWFGAVLNQRIMLTKQSSSKKTESKTSNFMVYTMKPTSLRPSKEYIGIVGALKSVDLKPQVEGYVQDVLFKEGSFVKKGDLLFVIEQEKYIAILNIRKAELEKEKADFVRLEKEFKRQSSLNKNKFASDAVLEKTIAELNQSKASIKQAQANLDLAKIELSHTEVRAPISGKIGKAFATKGNYVTASGEPLAKIVQQKPIRVAFAFPDKDYLKAKESGDKDFDIEVILSTGSIFKEKPLSVYFDNEIDKRTATIPTFAEFKNESELLVAGNYVKVHLFKQTPEELFLLPIRAITQDRQGAFVLTVDNESKVQKKRVKLGRTFDKNQEILTGLTLGDKVILEGLTSLVQGQKIKTEEVE